MTIKSPYFNLLIDGRVVARTRAFKIIQDPGINVFEMEVLNLVFPSEKAKEKLIELIKKGQIKKEV